MSEQICPHAAEFEHDYISPEKVAAGISDVSLCLGAVAMEFAAVDRVPRYTPETRENDAEHSYMLALIATEIADQFFPPLDGGLVGRFALVHDLVELETGDVATFGISDEELEAKLKAEHLAKDRLISRLPKKTALLLEVYEQQLVPEARFVRLVDKLMPLIVDILGPGSQVMHEDYSTYTHKKLNETEKVMNRRFSELFPEPDMLPLLIARKSLADAFGKIFTPLKYAQDTLF